MAPIHPSAELPRLARHLLVAGGDLVAAAHAADREDPGGGRVPRVLHTAMTAGGFAPAEWGGELADMRAMSVSFMEALRGASIVARLVADGAVASVQPGGGRVVVVSGAAVGGIAGHGLPRRISEMALTGEELEPRTASAIVIVSKELLARSGAAGQALLSRELRRAASAALDRAFIESMLTASPLPTATADAMDNLHAMLDAVNTQGVARLYWLAAPDVANRLATLRANATGPLLFEGGPGPQGGELLGAPLLVSGEILSGTIALIDASGFAIGLGVVELRVLQHATVEMSDTPADPTAAGTVMISLWQRNLVGLEAALPHVFALARPDAFAVLTGVNW